MENKKKTDREILHDAAKAQIRTSIQALGLNSSYLTEFFKSIYKSEKQKQQLIDSIDGGHSDKITDLDYGQRELYIAKRMYVKTVTIHFDNYLPDDFPFKRNLSELGIKRESLKLRKALFFCISSARESHTTSQQYYNWIVMHWRHWLEVFRVQLSLAGKNTYPPQVEHADRFIKILEKGIKKVPKTDPHQNYHFV